MTYAQALELEQVPRSAHFVDGRTSRAENPHMYRLATFAYHGTEIVGIKRHSGYVAQWIKQLEAADMPDDDAALMARLNAMPVPSAFAQMEVYKTHSQRMSQWFRELDKANKGKVLEWKPITAERAETIAGEDKYNNRWTDRGREKAIETATKRGDIIPAIPNIAIGNTETLEPETLDVEEPAPIAEPEPETVALEPEPVDIGNDMAEKSADWYIGRTGYYLVSSPDPRRDAGEMRVRVEIVATRMAFGRVLCEIRPANGKGTIWVNAKSLEAVK